MLNYRESHAIVEESLATLATGREPERLYQPVEYILSIGGKRIRPCLTLMAHRLFSDTTSAAIPAALAIEVFHNFTLLHDDIMDKAPTRRNHPTVHTKWDENTAILSGDAMLILSYSLLEQLDPGILSRVLPLFNKTALEVCEGQQYDMNFESESNVSVEEYLEMIRLKTAVLLAASLAIGGITGGASQKDIQSLYTFGENLGIAFQLQDDFLDAFADAKKLGKSIGGDIVANKKTFMLIRALQANDSSSVSSLRNWIGATDARPQEKVEGVKAIYKKLGIDQETRKLSEDYFNKALGALDKVSVSKISKASLENLIKLIMKREH